MKFLPKVNHSVRDEDRRSKVIRDLIHREAKIGGELFGPIPEGHRREFFWLDGQTWIWHEEWADKQTGQSKVVTTRYEARPGGVLKSQNGHTSYIDSDEATNLYQAIQIYMKRVSAEVYGVAV